MPVFRAMDWDHQDTWKDLLLEHEKEINFKNIDFYQDLNLPMVMWKRKDCILEVELMVTYFKGIVTMERIKQRSHSKCELTYNDFLMMFIDADL